jgi:hypothetical protein
MTQLGDVHLTEYDLAKRLQLSVKTIRNHRVSGRGVPFLKLEGAVRYRAQDVTAYESARVRRSTSDRGTKDQAAPVTEAT